MGKCKNEELFQLISQDKLVDDDEFELRLKRNLPDCKRINATKPAQVSGGVSVNNYRRPKNRFECMRKGCVNTGLLMMEAANETATYKLPYDAVEFVGGVVTFYVYAPETPAKVTFKIGNEEALTNANIYETTITEVNDDGFAPVAIILADVPTSQAGDGWTPSTAGAYMQVSSDKVVGYSSFAILDYLEDFELNDIIKFRCATASGDDMTFELVEEQCTDAQYNQNVNSLNYTLTVNRVSSNYRKANPMYGKGKNREGFVPTTTKKVAESYSANGETFGRITLADANQDECGRIAVQYQDDCESQLLTHLSIPTLVDVDEGHFLVIENQDGTTDLVFNKEFIGKELLVSYPRMAEVKESVYSTEFLEDVEASLVHKKKLSDGTEIVRVFDNVFITTFPIAVTSESGAFNFTFAIARDANGYFFREMEVVA